MYVLGRLKVTSHYKTSNDTELLKNQGHVVRYRRKIRKQSHLNIGDFHNNTLISPPLKNANQLIIELAHERIGGRPCLFTIRQLFLNGQQ